MNEEKFNIELVSLDNINVLSATLENHSGAATMDRSGLEMSFQYQLIPAISIRSKKVQVLAEYEIRAAKSDSAPLDITSKYSIVFLFSVKNLPALAVVKENELTSVDEEMLSSLLNITYSTSRGILYTRYLGTVLDGVILPVISTADLLKPSAIKSIPAKK